MEKMMSNDVKMIKVVQVMQIRQQQLKPTTVTVPVVKACCWLSFPGFVAENKTTASSFYDTRLVS